MPHLVILYSDNLDAVTDMAALCRSLADVMLPIHAEDGRQVFPTGGVRVFAYPAKHFAIADGKRDYAFAYLNLRMGRGRSADVKQHVGRALLEVARQHFAPLLAERHIGVTFQIDEGGEVFDGKLSTIHSLFKN